MTDDKRGTGKHKPPRILLTWMEIAALCLTLAAILITYGIGAAIFDQMPHIEDEMAYVWQAKVYARGELAISSPPHPKSMLVPFVVDYQGLRFSKYPPGWSVLLSFGILLGIRAWVNPLLAGLSVWLTFRLGQKVFNSSIGLLASLLMLASPFFLLNSSALLSHPWSLVLSLSFLLAWLDCFPGKRDQAKQSKSIPAWLTTTVAGLSLGVLALTRPLTAIGVGLPCFIHGIIILIRGNKAARLKVLLIGAISLATGSLVLAWQYAVTGDPLLNPYTLWWSYDRIGFGPEIGRQEGGHNWFWAWFNLKFNLRAAQRDIFGWGMYSWFFMLLGLWAGRRKASAWLSASVFPSLAATYMLYWIGAELFGPRYYYEALHSLTLFTAAGIAWLAGAFEKERSGWQKARLVGVLILVVLLFTTNLVTYLPGRLEEMRGLYGIEKSDLEPFLKPEAQSLTPALVIISIKENWTDYGALLELEDPWLETPFIFAISRYPQANDALIQDYPERRVIFYNPQMPESLFWDSE